MPNTDARSIAVRLAYDGRPFHGFQRQPDVETVEGALFDALGALGVAFEDGAPVGYAAAGRTDAGVSAAAQVVALRAPDWLFPPAINAELPESVWAWATAAVPAGFHATHDASKREYTYYLYTPPEQTDDGAVRTAAERLSGEHDVHNLTLDDANTVRNVRVAVERVGDVLVLTFRAGGFPRQYVRRAVTLLRDAGTGAADVDLVDRALGPEPLDGKAGIAAAPPHPLVLSDVCYPDVSFDVDRAAAADARERFEAARREHVSRARAGGSIVQRMESPGADSNARGK